MKKVVALIVLCMLFAVGLVFAQKSPSYITSRNAQVLIDYWLDDGAISRLADNCIQTINSAAEAKGTNFVPGKTIVRISYNQEMTQLAKFLQSKMLLSGYLVETRPLDPGIIYDDFYQNASDEQFYYPVTGMQEAVAIPNIQIFLGNPASDTQIASAYSNPDLMALLDKREKEGSYFELWINGCGRQFVEQSGLSLDDYFANLEKFYLLDQDPSVLATNLDQKRQIAQWLNDLKIKTVHYTSSNKDIDLTVSLGQERKWICASGANYPSYEIFTSPSYKGVVGTWCSNKQVYLNDTTIGTATIKFNEDGTTELAYDGKRCGYLKKYIEEYKELGSELLAEISLVDKRISPIEDSNGDAMSNENVQASGHIAIGRPILDTYAGSENEPDWESLDYANTQCPLHFDFVYQGDLRVTATTEDGKQIEIYKDGQFVYEFKKEEQKSGISVIESTLRRSVVSGWNITPALGKANWSAFRDIAKAVSVEK